MCRCTSQASCVIIIDGGAIIQEMLSEETPRIYRVATKDAQGNDIDEYKYHENKWPTDYTKMKTNEEERS